MNITKDNLSIVDYTQVYKDNTSLQYRPSQYKIIITLCGVELVSNQTYTIEDVIKARDDLINTVEVDGL